MAAPYLIETYGYSKAQIGFVGSALGLAYGISKFIMGNVSDRCNPRYFLPLGLILAVIANIMLGFASSVPLLNNFKGVSDVQARPSLTSLKTYK